MTEQYLVGETSLLLARLQDAVDTSRDGTRSGPCPGAGGYEPDAGLGAGLGEAGELGDEAGLITTEMEASLSPLIEAAAGSDAGARVRRRATSAGSTIYPRNRGPRTEKFPAPACRERAG